MINRIIFGHHRYGEPKDDKFYYDRCQRALKQYERTRNQEYLIDAANYCLLEIHKPQYSDVYFRAEDSAGRNKKI